MLCFLTSLCFLALIGFSAQEKLCKEENRNLTEKAILELCPIYRTMTFPFEEIVKCKEKTGDDLRGAFKKCAINVFNDISYSTSEMVQKTMCDEKNFERAVDFTCCLITVETDQVPGQTAQGTVDQCRACARNPNV